MVLTISIGFDHRILGLPLPCVKFNIFGALARPGVVLAGAVFVGETFSNLLLALVISKRANLYLLLVTTYSAEGHPEWEEVPDDAALA